MPRVAAYATVLALVACASLALVACGGSDAKLLPGNTAAEIGENLDSVQQLVDEGECLDAQDAALEVSTEVEALRGIDPELKQALGKGAARLNEVVGTCTANLSEDELEEETVPEETEAEEPEKKEKKPKKVEPEATAPEEAEEAKPPAEHELPPQAKGEAKGHEEEAPPAEAPAGEEPSGGIGPGSATGEG